MADVLTATLAAIAERLRSVDGITTAHYPAPNALNDAALPAAVVYSGSPTGESTIGRDLGSQVWTPAVMVHLYGKRVGNTPQEFAAIDRLIVPVVDAFTGPLTVDVDGTPQHIDRVLVSGYRGTLTLGYAGQEHYGAEFYLSIKFRRAGG